VCCHLIYACERVHDYPRASQWCDVVSAISQEWGIRGLFAVCSTHYANVLVWRGDWELAERELAVARDLYAKTAPALEFEAKLGLAEVRRRQGRLDEAAELCSAAEWNPTAQLCLAEIALLRGEVERAAELVARHLRALPEEARLARVAGLELSAQIACAAGDRAACRAASEGLSALAAEVRTEPLRASAALAAGLLAGLEGMHDVARRELEDAVDVWSRCGAPFEEAHARVELARVLLVLGRADSAARELRRARELLVDLDARGAISEVERLLAEAGDRQPQDGRDEDGESEVLSPREREVLRLVADGLADQEIASVLVLSPHTVHRHVANIRTKLCEPSRAAAAAHAIRSGLI
jgi:ATP/maltotriose-dependent transcriptional regulator MalT